MKTLHLLRHAKSAWDEPGLSDRERGLNRRGKRAAPAMGRALALRLSPVVASVSPARRAQLTLEGLCDGWPEMAALPHRTCESLYTFSADDVLDWLAEQDDALEELFLIGHNPAFTDVVNYLCGRRELDNLPTAGYAELGLDVDRWGPLRQGDAQLLYTLFPKELPAA